ncbi:MAG: SDR family NAD(P)-dependent oxidoreductase [Limnochordia bacterium]|nr:SDR family oxidoreductase [Limnochordia bacterium]MDI9439919.1 SDR family oxidoreductase [Bacillota bacterium]
MERRQRLQGKVVLITGASGGLGEQIAYAAARRGAVVVATARRMERLEAVQSRCRELSGGPSYAYPLDVADGEQVEEVLSRIQLDVGPVHVLVNSAGFGLFAEALETSQDITEDMFEVNVLGLIRLSREVARAMKEQGGGHIINIASQAGKIATPKSAVYAGTKFAVRGYSNALRLELKKFGINVTTVNPGPIRTDFFSKADADGSYLAKLGRWVLDPVQVAEKIAESMLTNRREINLPRIMEFAARLYVLFPRLGDFLTGTMFSWK